MREGPFGVSSLSADDGQTLLRVNWGNYLLSVNLTDTHPLITNIMVNINITMYQYSTPQLAYWFSHHESEVRAWVEPTNSFFSLQEGGGEGGNHAGMSVKIESS